MTDLKLAVQTLLLPGRDLEEKFDAARRYGFDAVEVAIGPDFELIDNVGNIQSAVASSGLPVAAICTHPIHDPLQPDLTERAKRFAALTELVAAATEVGARGVVSVPVRPARGFASRAEQLKVVADLTEEAVEEFTLWSQTIPRDGAALFLEPLIRFEAFFLNRVDQAVDIAKRVNHPRLLALGDLFHMNVEESDLARAFRYAGDLLGHVHIADNNRLQPSLGSLDLTKPFAALHEINYSGYVSIECFSPAGPRIEGDPETAFPESIRYLRDIWRSNASTT